MAAVVSDLWNVKKTVAAHFGKEQFNAMTYVGKISKGAIILPPDVHLPDGMMVEIKPLHSDAEEFTDALEQMAARVKGLPSDLAQNHDHYLHGLPKK